MLKLLFVNIVLAKKLFLFNKLVKLSFFYRVKKQGTLGFNCIGEHNQSLLFNINKILYFLFKLTPFFFNLVKQRGCIFFIGINLILFKWFKNNSDLYLQEIIAVWKSGVFSHFFNINNWSKNKAREFMVILPISLIFLNFDCCKNEFKEVNSFNLPTIGLFTNILNPNLVYALGGLSHSFFIVGFFFKLFSRFLKHLN